MTIPVVSRYSNQSISRVPHKNGGRVPVMGFKLSRVRAISGQERTYMPQDGEFVDMIALAMYQTPHLFHFIVERNDALFWPLDVSSDTPLQIPPDFAESL